MSGQNNSPPFCHMCRFYYKALLAASSSTPVEVVPVGIGRWFMPYLIGWSGSLKLVMYSINILIRVLQLLTLINFRAGHWTAWNETCLFLGSASGVCAIAIMNITGNRSIPLTKKIFSTWHFLTSSFTDFALSDSTDLGRTSTYYHEYWIRRFQQFCIVSVSQKWQNFIHTLVFDANSEYAIELKLKEWPEREHKSTRRIF